MKLALAVALAVLCMNPLIAGDTEGSGGDGVICTSGTSETIELLDYYEARTMLMGVTPDLPGSTLQQKIENVLSRLHVLDEAREIELKKTADIILKELLFVPSVPEIDDEGRVRIFDGCKKVQLAYQDLKALPLKRKYFIVKSLWDRLSLDHQAGLILHEAIYRHFALGDHTNSEAARYFHELLSDPTIIPGLLQEEYLQLLVDVSLQSYYWKGIQIKPTSTAFYPSGKIWVIYPHSDDYPTLSVNIGAQTWKGSFTSIWLFEDGNVSELYGSIPPVPSTGKLMLFGRDWPRSKYNGIRFSPSGLVEAIHVTSFQTSIRGEPNWIQGTTDLHANGAFKRINVSERNVYRFLTLAGEMIHVSGVSGSVYLDEDEFYLRTEEE